MRIQKRTILIVAPITLIFLILGFLVEFWLPIFPHSGFLSSILLGIFASGLLIVITSWVAFLSEKGRYYRTVFSLCSEILSLTITLIEGLKEEDCTLRSGEFIAEIGVKVSQLKIEMWDFTCFFRRGRKDTLVDSVALYIAKVSVLLNELLKYSWMLYRKGLSRGDYNEVYRLLVKEICGTYLPQLQDLLKLVKETGDSLIKDRTLHSIFNDAETGSSSATPDSATAAEDDTDSIV